MACIFRFGIEEEFFLCDFEGRGQQNAPPDFWREIAKLAPAVGKELLQAQIETNTEPCASFAEALAALIRRRSMALEIAARFDMTLMASGTHPTADWRQSVISAGERYTALKRDMRMLGWRNMYCGLHVHVETPPGADRIRIVNRCASFLPLLLALSVSSPFWRGDWTGMYGYRLSGYDELPRTGLAPVLPDEESYDAYAGALIKAGLIADPTYIWWAMRPSSKYPTVELRICDATTYVAHAAAIGSLFRALVRRLCVDERFGPNPSPLLRAIAEENRWQAQCKGTHATMVDPRSLEPASARGLILQLCEYLAEDFEALEGAAALPVLQSILADGASAEHQVTLMQERLQAGADLESALGEVSRSLIAATARF